MSYPKQFNGIKPQQGSNPLDRLDISGYVRIGEPRDDGKGKVNGYFRLTEAGDEYENHFKAMFGDQPKVMPIYFPTSNIDIIKCHQLEAYLDKRRWGYGDGHQFMIYDESTHQYQLTQKGTELYNRINPKLWKEQLTLRFRIPHFPGTGFYALKTGGANSSIPKILNSLEYVRMLMGGDIAHMLFFLKTRIVTKKEPGTTYRYAFVTLTSAYSPEQIMKIQKGIASGDLKPKEIVNYSQYAEYLMSQGDNLLPMHEKLTELALGKKHMFELRESWEAESKALQDQEDQEAASETVSDQSTEPHNPNQQTINFE